MTNDLLKDLAKGMTKDQFFAEVKELESRAMYLVGGGSDKEFDEVISRSEELLVIAKHEGWIL